MTFRCGYAAKCAAAVNTIAHAATSIDKAPATAWANLALLNWRFMRNQPPGGHDVPLHRDARGSAGPRAQFAR